MLEALADAVIAELEGANWDAPPVYVIVPDAAALAVEREILRRLHPGGSMRLRVSSPARAAGAILRALGQSAPEPLSSGALRAQVRLRAAALGTLSKLSLTEETAAGAEGRLAQTIEELLWHAPGMPDGARAAIGAARAAAIEELLPPLLAPAAAQVPESILYWRCAGALGAGDPPPGSVHWAVGAGLPALEALRAALQASAMPFLDHTPLPPDGAAAALGGGVQAQAFVCRDLEDEARAATLRVRDLLRRGARPDEIAIGCADEALRHLLQRMLYAARVPADFGGRRTEGEALVECIAGLTELAGGASQAEALLRVVGSGLVPEAGDRRDALLLALREARGQGAAPQLLPPALLPGAADWPRAASFLGHLRHLAAWLVRLGLPDAFDALGEDAAARQSAIWNAFWTLSQAAGEAAGDALVPRASALRAIGDLLGAARPAEGPRRGAVRVLGISGLAGASCPHVLLVGLTEGAFPGGGGRQGILEPEALAAAQQAGAAIGRGPEGLRLAAQAQALSALASASETLWLSGAGRGERGTQGFSPLAAEVATPLPWSPPQVPRGGLGAALSRREAGIRIASAIARRREIRAEDGELLPIAAAHLAVVGDGPHFAGFRPRTVEAPVGEILGEIAVTALEQFGACRFRWLGGRLGLGGDEPADALDPRTRGTLAHRMLADLPYGAGPEIDLAATVRAAVAAAVGEDDELAPLRDAAGPRGRALREEATQELLRAARMVAAEERASAFRLVGRELAFGQGKQLEPLEVPLPGGGTAVLRGRIDRLEEAEGFLRVTDFKVRTKQRFDFTRLFHGVDLQVGAYLVAALRSAMGAGKRAAAAVYWPVRVGVRTPEKQDEPSDEHLWQDFRQRGLYLGDLEVLPLLDQAHPRGGSPFHPLALRKDGGFTSTSPIVPEPLWPDLERHIARTLGRLAAGLQAGEADPNPYAHDRDTACRTCDLLAICRYEAGIEGYRRLETATVEAVRGA